MSSRDRNRFSRREVLEVLGAAGLALAAGCTSASPASPTDTSVSGGTTTPVGGAASCSVTPEETAGPYSDRVGMINNPAFFRQDITEGRSGLPVTLALTVVSVSGGCNPVPNAQIEIWQCDAEGRYSEYSQPGYNGTGQTFLRGLQTTDGEGKATFVRSIPVGMRGGPRIFMSRCSSAADRQDDADRVSRERVTGGLRNRRICSARPESDHQRRR